MTEHTHSPVAAGFGGKFGPGDEEHALFAMIAGSIVNANLNNESDLAAFFVVPRPGIYTVMSWSSENSYEDTCMGVWLNGSLATNVFLKGSTGAVEMTEPLTVALGDVIVITYGAGTPPGIINLWLA